MNLRFTKPRLRPVGSTALVMTRPWYFADTATRPPLGDSNTLTGPKREREATSSANVVTVVFGFMSLGGGGGDWSAGFCGAAQATRKAKSPSVEKKKRVRMAVAAQSTGDGAPWLARRDPRWCLRPRGPNARR